MSSIEEFSRQIFTRFDKDKSGTIDRKELKGMLEELTSGSNYKVTEQDINDALKDLDSNNDGVVSEAEFLELVKAIVSE